MKVAFILLALLTAGGCATHFTGSAYVEGGVTGCKSKCTAQGLEFGGIVYLGEYSNACICEAPGAGDGAAAAAAATGASVGVATQMQRAQAQQQQGW